MSLNLDAKSILLGGVAAYAATSMLGGSKSTTTTGTSGLAGLNGTKRRKSAGTKKAGTKKAGTKKRKTTKR